MTCPHCDGKKSVMAFVHFTEEAQAAGKVNGYQATDCRTCEGTGQVDDDYPERMARADALRADRISRHVSLRAEAERLGITPAQLSARENGRA